MAQAEYVKQFLKGVKVLHLALTGLLCVVLGGLVYMRQNMPNAGVADVWFERIMLGLAFVGAFMAFSIGSYVYRTRLNVLKNAERIEMKLEGYRAAMIFRFALWEGVAIFSMIGYLRTGNIMFTGVTVFFILLLALVRPTAGKIAFELELSEAEKAMLSER